MASPPLTAGAVYSRIKTVIAAVKNVPRAEILADHDLRDDLGFDDIGVRALAIRVSEAFADVAVTVSRDEMEATDTVRDVSRLVRGKMTSHA